MLMIERHDIKKLEDYIERIEQYRKEMKFTHFELLNNINSETNNIGMKNKYERLCNIVNGVDQLIDEADKETKEIMRFRYWECPIGCYEWQDIADYFGISKTSMLRKRDAIIRRLATLIGYV
ncbi:MULTISPECIES: transcriptional regulator [Staphylococcus]|uniref:transcriptional regulator n=1 Tax=Staphylococcus TaxID=1279 RepID=UPI0007D8DEED|nr:MULTISPECIES: transcriptional regulator [Staphylococcus]MCI2838427.1 transcriptional regulator [Staphylococcus hominis]MCI2853846.1 transcriptional regulator [Staphylococcus hominis]MDS3850785.1 transcriptional regulator [Staphylococcus hominis]MDS3887448.1 transcriptional regulator [Staphylococcus hominis]OAO00138.1 transcriptional regulator [Staphylococcus hominis]